ncbi:FtsB family cell division protein [Salinicoccus sp. HZC-1]|uniref:FtsB family cell division protein n=1 Tax=Salinicoccus sp. HZC-1 TaxID=3385497 RepID=UPI00398B05F4
MPNKVVRMINSYTKRRETEKKVRQSENRVAKRRTLLFGSLMLIMAGILLIVAFNQKNQNHLLNEELLQTQEVMDERIEEEKDLEQQIKQLNDEDYIARIARSEFFFSEEGEIIFNLPEADDENMKKDE